GPSALARVGPARTHLKRRRRHRWPEFPMPMQWIKPEAEAAAAVAALAAGLGAAPGAGLAGAIAAGLSPAMLAALQGGVPAAGPARRGNLPAPHGGRDRTRLVGPVPLCRLLFEADRGRARRRPGQTPAPEAVDGVAADTPRHRQGGDGAPNDGAEPPPARR